MIELSEELRQAVQQHSGQPLLLVDPATRETFVLLPAREYEQLRRYDDSPWTDEEMELLAWEAGKLAGWEDMDAYDHYEKKS